MEVETMHELDPYDELKNKLVEGLEETDFKLLMVKANSKIPKAVPIAYQYTDPGTCFVHRFPFFNELRRTLGYDGALAFLLNAFEDTPIYLDQGLTDVRNEIRRCQEQYKMKRSMFDKSIVGRTDLITSLLNDLLDPYINTKVFVLHGEEGVGKTTVAKQLCRSLTEHSKNWEIIIVKHRMNPDIDELLFDLLHSLSDTCAKISNETELTKPDDVTDIYIYLQEVRAKIQSLLKDLKKSLDKRFLVVIDDINDYRCEAEKHSEKMTAILLDYIIFPILKEEIDMKLLITSSKSLLSICKPKDIKAITLEFELGPLTVDDVKEILKNSGTIDDIKHRDTIQLEHICQDVLKVSKGNQMKVCLISSMLRTVKFEDIDIHQPIETIFKIHLLENSHLLDTLYCAAVYQNYTFSSKDIRKLLSSDEDDLVLSNRLEYLLENKLIQQSFSEIRHNSVINNSNDVPEWYLHPSLLRLLKNTRTCSAEIKSKKTTFVRNYLETVLKPKKRTMSLQTESGIAKHTYLMWLFADIVIEDRISLSPLFSKYKKNINCSLLLYRLWVLITTSYLNRNPEFWESFIKLQAEIEENKDTALFWKVALIKFYISKGDIVSAEQVCKDTISQLSDSPSIDLDVFSISADNGYTLAAGMFYESLGRFILNKYSKMQTVQLKDGITYTDAAIKIYNSKKSALPHIADRFVAFATNLKGCIYFKCGRYLEALECHDKALKPLKNNFKADEADFRANRAVTYYKLGMDERDLDKRSEWLKKAAGDYNIILTCSDQPKLVSTNRYATYLSIRGETYFQLGDTKKAISDARYAKDMASDLNMQAERLVTSTERLGYYLHKHGKRLLESDPLKEDFLKESVHHYDEALSLIDENNDVKRYFPHIKGDRDKAHHLLRKVIFERRKREIEEAFSGDDESGEDESDDDSSENGTNDDNSEISDENRYKITDVETAVQHQRHMDGVEAKGISVPTPVGPDQEKLEVANEQLEESIKHRLKRQPHVIHVYESDPPCTEIQDENNEMSDYAREPKGRKRDSGIGSSLIDSVSSAAGLRSAYRESGISFGSQESWDCSFDDNAFLEPKETLVNQSNECSSRKRASCLIGFSRLESQQSVTGELETLEINWDDEEPAPKAPRIAPTSHMS